MKWNNNVGDEKYVIVRPYYLTGTYNNKSLHLLCYDDMFTSRKNFKYELQRNKLRCTQSESNKIALKLIIDRNHYWIMISNNLKKHNSHTPNNIENEHSIVDITKFWFNYFNNMFNNRYS